MLPFEPERLESMRARLPAALSVVYEAGAVSLGGQRPGELRQHVFDFEDGVRCVFSLDRDGPITFLHMSFSCQEWTKLQLISFLNRVEAIPVEFWPDTLLLELKRFQTPRAVHVAFEIPPGWDRFFKVCESTPRTGSSAP